MTTFPIRASSSTTIHQSEDRRTAVCGAVMDPYFYLGTEALRWNGYSQVTLEVCRGCAAILAEQQQPVVDPNPTISVQHRCPRMGEHIRASWRGPGLPGSGPGDLQVPCPDCYSIVITCIRVPWQPAAKDIPVSALSQLVTETPARGRGRS
jgi:hypothetical protein